VGRQIVLDVCRDFDFSAVAPDAPLEDARADRSPEQSGPVDGTAPSPERSPELTERDAPPVRRHRFSLF